MTRLVRKSFLDFRLLLSGMWPNKECVSCTICLVLSILAHTSLLMSGDVIPTNKYKSSTKVGLRHALFRSGSSISVCEELAHTGAAYSANAVVRIVLAFVPHFEYNTVNHRILIKISFMKSPRRVTSAESFLLCCTTEDSMWY